jgi:hypothetical protein
VRSLFLIVVLVAAIFLLPGCFDSSMYLDLTPSAVIHYYSVEGQTETFVDAGACFSIEYTWKVGSSFRPPKRDLRAFVHFVDESGNIIIDANGSTIQDDHELPIPLSQWKAGEDVVYTRQRVVFPRRLGAKQTKVKMLIGLYDPETNDRARLEFPEEEQTKNKAYQVKTILIRVNESIFPIFNTTWYGPEPGGNEMHRWSKSESLVTFERDKWAEAADLWIAGHSPIEDLAAETAVQTMRIYIHEKKPEFMIAEEPLRFVRPGSTLLGQKNVFIGESLPPTRFPIPQHLFDTFSDQPIRILFEVDNYLVPGGTDNREELGFLFNTILLVPKNRQR